jgi:hypothetical protein
LELIREKTPLLNKREIGDISEKMGKRMGEKMERKVAKARGDDHFRNRETKASSWILVSVFVGIL